MIDLSSATGEPHARARLRTQRDVGRGRDVLPGLQGEPKALSDRGQDQHGFHRRERVADALARAPAEREIREARQAAGEIAGPALGTEGFGVIEPSAIAMHDPRRHDHDEAWRDSLAGDLAWVY